MLDPRKKYLQVALNSNLTEAKNIIDLLPVSDRIILEAGTPLIKQEGAMAIKLIRSWWESKLWGTPATSWDLGEGPDFLQKLSFGQLVKTLIGSGRPQRQVTTSAKASVRPGPYIVADLKAMDRGLREVDIARQYGASAVTALGNAPLETINVFIKHCKEVGLDSMLDMMNVPQPVKVLQKIKKLPTVVMLHRGVDEEQFNSLIPFPAHLINKIKGGFATLIAIAGGDTINEIRSAVFNGADIVVVWKEFYQSTQDTQKMASEFLKEIK